MLLAMREGFHSLGEDVNRHLRILPWRDVKLLVSGMERIEPSMVLKRLQFEGFSPQSSTPEFLRMVINDMSSETLRLFLKFVTAQESLPVATAPKPIKVVMVAGDDNRLPASHACFLTLDLPDYSSTEALRRRLMEAIGQPDAFTMN